MSKQFYFFKKVVQGGLGNDTFLTLWELLESWTSQNNWMAIFFIIFLGIIFEIILFKICMSFQKKPELPSEKDKSDIHKKEDNGSCLTSMKLDNWSALSSSEARVDNYSERTIASSITSEGNEEYFEDSIPPPDEPPRESTSESRFRVSHFSESHMTSSNGTSSSSLSLFHSEVQEILLRCSRCPKNECETIQFSSKKLFSIMKSNRSKNKTFSSDFNFSRTSRIIIESEDLDVAPCPPAHLFLSRDQVRLLEENVRNQSPPKSKATLENKTTSLSSVSLEPLIQNQHSATMDLSPQAQTSFSRQKATQNQGFSKAQFIGQAHQFFNNQASVNRQPESEARYFALPQDLVREPLTSSTQDSFQTTDMDRCQHLIQVPQSTETQDSVKGLGSDTKHLDEAQDSVWSEESNKIKYSIPVQDTILQDARHLVLPPSPNSVDKVMPQREHVKSEGQKQIASSTLNQSPSYGSLPLMTRQKNRRKTLRHKSELSLKDPPQKSKKTPVSQVLQTTACHTSECSQLRYEHKTKKKKLHQRKGVSDIASHFTYAFKLVPPYIRKYYRKRQVKFTPGLTECRDFLPKPDQSLCAEKVNYIGSVEEEGTMGSTENEEQHGRNNKELENISQEIPSQLEQSFMVNTYQQKVPCPSLIETNWMNKESLEDPKEMDIGESCAPNSETTSDLPIARQETPLEEAISEPSQKCVSSPQMESDRNMKTWEDLRGSENSNPALSSREELPTSISEMQRCFSQGNTDRKDLLEIVLESSDINLFIPLGTEKHKSSGQPAVVEIQERPEDVTEKKKNTLRVHVMEDDISGSEELECNTRNNINNMQDERISPAFHEAAHTALSLPPRMKMQSELKTKMDTSEIGLNFSAVKPDELPDDRKIYFSFEKNCLVKKPQEDNREEEQQAPQEAALQLTPGFRFSLRLQQKPTYVQLEPGQNSSKGRTTQNKDLDVYPQTLSTETTVETNPHPVMDPFQVEVKQSTDRPTGRETADPVHPLTVFESLPVLTESTECGVPLGGSPEKFLDAQIAEEKQDLEGVLPEVTLESFHRHMPPLSNLKRKKIRKKISGTTNVLGFKCVISKVKKPPKCHRRRLRSNFKIMIKHILQDKSMADMLLNVTDPCLSILPHVRMHSRLNVGNQSHTKLKQETSEAEREDYLDIINKGSDSGNTLEAARLQEEVSGDQEASPEAVLEDRWNLRLDEDPEKELKSMKEMQQPSTLAEIMAESIHMATTGPVHVENMEKSLIAPTDLRCAEDDSEISPPTSEKSLIGDPLNQTRESDVPDDGSDTRETGYCFAAMKAERPKDLPAMFPKTFNCHMPVLSHSKVKKTRVRCSRIECRVNSKSVPMKALKPSISQMCDITGHQRKKLESDFKAKFEKIGQANGLEYEFLNTLYSPVHSRLPGAIKSFSHVQPKLWGLAVEERPLYVDFFDESNALCDRVEKGQDVEEKEQKTLLITAPQHTQYLWINGCQGRETHLAEPDAGLHRLTQEQDTQHQTCFKQAALQTDVQMGPREAKELLKTKKPEDDLTAPAGLEVLPPEAGNSSPVKLLSIPTECGVASGGNLTRERGSYSVDKKSALPESLQVIFLQSSGSTDTSVSKSQRKKNTLKLARKQTTVNCRYRAMREQNLSTLCMLPGSQRKALQCNFQRKDLQQNKNTGDMCSPVILSRVPVWPNTKMSIGLNVETDTQRITRLDHRQMQEKSPNERKVCCPASMDMSTLPNSVKDRKQKGAEEQDSPIPESGQGFIFSTYQEQDHDLIKSDEGQKQTGSINIYVQPQTHFAESILSSASCPTLDPFQLRKLESDARFFPPTSGEAKFDEKIFSAREGGIPSEANHQKGQAGGTEKEEKVTLDFCMAALSLSKGKRNFKQYSDMKILKNPKCGILKAKKPPISHMLNIKGGARRNRRKALGYNLNTKMGQVGQGTKMADGRDSLLNIIPAINRYSDQEGKKDMLGEKRLSSEQVMQNIPPHERNVTPDDPEEGDLQDEESKQEMLLKVIPQHSQHFILCSDQTKELELHKPGKKGCGETLFFTKQDIPQRTQPADPVQAMQPKSSQQTQNGTVWSASSNLPLLKSNESLTGQVAIDTMKCDVPSDESHLGELDDHGKEEKSEFKKDLQAPVPESSATATPDPPEPKQGRKTFTCRALKSKMSPKCVAMKARKAPVSQIFNIPGNGCLKTLPSKALRSQIIEFLIEIKSSGALEDVTAERKEGGAQELLAAMLEFWEAATLALPVSKRERNHSELTDKINKMRPKCITLKAKKTPISKTFNVTKRGVPSRGRQFEGNFKSMRKQGQSLAVTTPKATSSPMSVSLDMKVHNRTKVETDMPGKTSFHPELQQQGHWPDGGGASCPYSRAEREKARKELKGHGAEAAPRNFQHLTSSAHHMKEACFVKSDLKRKYSARGKIPESLTIAEELQQRTFFAQSVLRSVSSSILNSLPSEKASKRTKTQRSRILSPATEKSLGESLAVKVPSDVLPETDPAKEPANSSPEGKKELQTDSQGRALQSLGISRPDSSEIKGLRNAALIPTSRTGEAQMASVLKTTNTTSPSAPSHGKELVYTFDNMAKELSQSMSDIFMNASFSPTPVSPATKTHRKRKAKKDPVEGSIIQLKPEDRKRACKRCSALGTTSQSGRQNEREGKEVAVKTESRKDENMLITERDMQQQTLVSENILESTCSPLIIPFQTEKVKKNIPPYTNILHRKNEKIPRVKREKAMVDGLLIVEAGCRTPSAGNPTRRLDASSPAPLPPEEEKDIKTQKVTKYTADQNTPLPTSGISALGDSCNESCRRKVGGSIVKKYKELQRDLLTISTTSVLSESRRQKKALKFPEWKDLMGPRYITMKTKRPLSSQVLNITEHGHQYCKKKQECYLKSVIKDRQQHKCIADAFSSLTPVSMDNKIDIEIDSTLTTGTDQPRVQTHNHTCPELEKSLSAGEAREANLIDTQSRSSNTGRVSVPHEKEEENVPEISAESVPHKSQYLRFTSHHVKNLGPCKSKPKLDSSEGRSSWNLSCAAQNMRQEEHIRKTILKPVSKSVMTLIRVQTLKKVLHTQEEIQHMADLKTPFPEAGKSETGSLHCDGVWDGNPRRKGDSPIFKKKARSQSDLPGTVLEPLGFSSLDSSEPESQTHAVEAVGKESTLSPRQATLQAGELPVLQELTSTRCLTGNHREKTHKLKTKAREKQWNEGARKTSFHASEGAKSPPTTLVTDKLSFDTAVRGSLDNHGTLHKNLGDFVTEKKAELDETLATVLLGPFDLFMPVLSDSESQINTVQEKIIPKRKCSVMKKKEPLISQLFKISRQSATKQRTKFRSKVETKMKEMLSGKNATDMYTNATYFEVDTSNIRRQSRFQTEADRISGFNPVQPTHTQLPVEDRVVLQSLNATGPAALSINKEQEIDTHREKAVLNTDLKSTDASPSIPPHTKMEQSPNTSSNYEESSEKRNALKKAKGMEEKECEQQVLSGTSSQYTQSLEFLQKKQQELYVSGNIQNSAYAYTPLYPQILNHQANAKAAGVESTVPTEQVKSKAKKPFVSLVYNTAGHGTRSHEKETRFNTKKQKPGFQQEKTEVEFSLKTICDPGSIPPQIQELMEAEREKGKPPRPEKSLNTRQIAFSQFLAKSAKSRNRKTFRQCIREQEENCQIASLDLFPQCRYRFVMRQQLKKSPTHVKYTVNLKREAHPAQLSPKTASCSTTFDISRVRLHTKRQRLIALGVKEGDRDRVQPPVSTLQRTEVSEKTDISLSSKGQNMCLPESDASQEKTCKEQDLLKEGSNSRTLVEPTLYSITETSHLENTIPNQLARDGLRETDTLQGSKGQTFLCANAEARQYTPAVEIGDVKPDPIPECLLDSASCPSEELHVREAGNATRKERVSIPVVPDVDLWETEMPKLTNLLLTSNEQKINCSEKERTEQRNSANPKKGNLLEFISSCILYQLHNERRKKEISAKGMSSAVLSPVVQKASNTVDTPVDQPPCSGRRKEHQQESTRKALPTSLSHSMMNIFQIKLPGVMKAAKEVDRPRHHNSNTEGIGLPGAGTEEQPECVQRIWPNLASDPSRDILFQSKMPYEKTISEEVVSTVEYTPSSEGHGSHITGKGGQQEKWMSETLQKSTSHSQAGLHQTNISVQEVKFDDTSKMHSEYSTPQAKEALKGMDVIFGYTQNSEKGQNLPSVEQKQQHLLIPSENFPSLKIPSEHTSYPQNNPWPLPHLTPQTKEALSEVGNVSSRTKGLDLISKEQLNTQRECGLEWTVPSAPPTQMTRQNTRPPLDSSSETAKYQNVSSLKGKKLLDGEQIIDSITNVSSPKLSVRKKVHLRKACRKKVQKEVCLPGFFSHSLSIHMPPLPENKRQKNDLKQGVEKDMVPTQRTWEKLIFSNIFNTTDYGGPGNRPDLPRKIKEKMVNLKHRKVKPDLVVTDVYESIPSLKLNIKTADEIISNNVKRIKQLMSQRKEKIRIKGVDVKGTMDPNITLKAKKPSRSYLRSEKELPGQLNIIKQESEGQTGKGMLGVKLTNLFAAVPSLSPLDLNLRTKGGRDSSRIPQTYLPPLKLQATSNIRKASFAESINRESLSNIIESKRCPQQKREDGDNIGYMTDKRDCKRATFKRKKKLFKHTPNANEPQWNNKEQEQTMQENESDGKVALNKPRASIPSSSPLEQGPGVKEAASQTVSWCCPPSLTLQELSDAVTACKEPADDILSNIARSKYMSQENEDRVGMALKEIRHPQRMPLEVNQSPVAQELQVNINEKEEKMQQDKGKQVGIQRQSCVPISSPPYSKVDTRRRGEAVVLRRTRPCFLEPKPQEPSDTGNIAYEKSVSSDISNRVKQAKEHAIQEEEERVNMEEVFLLKKKNSPLSQEIRLDVKEQKKKTHRIQGEPSVILIYTSRPATSFNLNTRIIEADDRAEVIRYSCSELPHQKSSDVVKKANRDSTEIGIISKVQGAKDFMPQKGEDQGETANMNYMRYSKEISSKAREFPLPHIPSNPGSHSPQTRDEPANRRENPGHAQERKSELDEVLTGLCPPQFTSNKGKKENQGALKSCLPPLGRRKSSDAQELKYTVSPLSETSSDSKRTNYMTWEEKDKANIFVRDPMHPKSLALKVRKSPLFRMLEAKKLQVNIKEPVKREQKGRRDTVVILSKIFPFVTSSTHLKSDTMKEDKGGPGVLRHSVPYLKTQASRPSVQKAPLKSTDRKKEKQYPPPTESNRAHATVVRGAMPASGSDFKAKTSSPRPMLGVTKHDALSRRKEVRPSVEESTGQGRGRTGEPGVTATTPTPALPSPSDRRLDAGIKEDKHSPAVTGFSPPFQLLESSGAGKIRHADFSQGISSCNITVRANGRVSYTETEIRVKRKDEKDRTHPRITAVEAQTSPLTHLLSRNRLPLNVKEQGKEMQDGNGELGMVLRETRASLPSPSYLRQDTSRNEKKDAERITQFCFPPLKIFDPLHLNTKADAKSFDGYLLKNKARLKTDNEDRVLPISVHQKAKELPLSHDTKESQCKMKKQKKMVQREDSELATRLKNVCTSLLTLPYLKSDTPEGERYVIRITKLPPPQAESPIVLTHNLTDLQGKTKGKVWEDKQEPGDAMQTETCASLSSSLHLDENTSIREEGMSMLPRSSLPPVNFQKSSSSEEVIHVESMASCTVISPRKEKYLPRNKKEDGVERRNFVSPKHQRKWMQESKDEPGMVLIKFSTSSPSLSALKLDKEVQVDDETLARTRSILQRVSFGGKLYTDTTSGDTTEEAQNLTKSTSSPFLPALKLDIEVQVNDEMLACRESALGRMSYAREAVHTETISGNTMRDAQNLTKISTSSPPLPTLKLNKEVQVNDEMLAHTRSVLRRISYAREILHRDSISSDITVQFSSVPKDGQNLTKFSAPSPYRSAPRLDKEVQVSDEMLARRRSVLGRVAYAGEIVHRDSISGETMKDGQNLTKISASSPFLPTFQLDKEVQVDDEMLAHRRSVLGRLLYVGEIAHTDSVSDDITKAGQNLTKFSAPSPSLSAFKLDKEVQVDDEMLARRRSALGRISYAGEIVHTETMSGNTMKDVQNLTKFSTSSPSLPALKLDKEVQVDDEMLARRRSALGRISYAGEIVHRGSIHGDTTKDGQNLTKFSASSPYLSALKLDKEVQVNDEMLALRQPVLGRISYAEETAHTYSISDDITKDGQNLTKFSISPPSIPALKLDKEVQVDDEMLAHRRSALGRISKTGQMIHTYSISGDSRKDVQNEEQPIPEEEERDREKSVDRRGVTHTKYIILKSKKSPPSYTLHRSELYLNLEGKEQKKQEARGKPPGKMVRNIYLATPPTKLKLDKGTQVDDGKLGIKKPSLLPRMISALSDAKKRTDTKGISGDVIKRKQCMSEKEKKLDVKNVDMRLRTHHKKSVISPIPDILSTKKFVLNVIKEPGEKVHKDTDEPSMVLTRTFLSIPSAPLYLDLESKTDKDTPEITGSSGSQQHLQETSDTQKTAMRESAAGEREIVKNAECSVPKDAMQQWTSNFVISVQQRREPLQVTSEGDVSRLLSNSQQEDFYVTGYGTIKSGKRLECFFAGSEAQQEKYKPETLATILSFPMMDLTKMESLKKETEIMNHLNHKISPHLLVSLPRKLSREICATLGSPVSSAFSASKQDVHHQQEALSQASPASIDLCKLDKPEEDRQNNGKTKEMSPPNVLAPQIKEPLEEMNLTESDALQNADQEIVMKKQVVLQSGSGQKTRVDSSLSLKIPLQHVKQRTSLEIDVHRQTTVCPGIQTLPGIRTGMTEFDAQRGKKEQTLLVPDKEAHSLEALQKSVSSWTFPLQSGDAGGKNETDPGSTGNLEQKKLEMKEGILKIDTNIAVRLEEDRIEMHKHTIVNLEEETIKMDTSNTVNVNTASLKAEEPQIKTQVITPMANRCPIKQKQKKEQEVSSAKHNIQLQKMLQKHALDSFYAYIPLPPKLGGQKGRLTIADLKRELGPKHLNMKIRKHPIPQILGNTGRGTPSNRKKLEYNFNKSKKIALRRGDASEIFIRSLSISTVSPSQTKDLVKSQTNLESAKRTRISEFQKKSPNTSETMKRDSSSIVKEKNQNFTKTIPQDSQPFIVDKQQMCKLPNTKSEANLSREINKNLAPQTNERVVPGQDISRIIKEPDVLMIKQEKAPKPTETPTECLIMSKDPKEIDHRDQSELVEDTAMQKVQQQETSLGIVPIQPQAKGNERKTVGYSPSAGIMIPICEAIKNVLESQIKNIIQNTFFPKNLEKAKDNKPVDWKSQRFTRGPSTLSMTIHPELQPKPILENFTCKEKVKLTNHLESKAPEIRLNLIPEVVKQSFQRFSFYQKLDISKHNSWKLYPRHKQMFFLPLEGIDTIEFNLKHESEKDSLPVNCMKSLIINVSRGSEEAVNITKLKRMKALEGGAPSLTSAREKTLPRILQNCSVGEKNKLLIHFSKKTLEIQMKAFPRIVRDSYTMANAQDGGKPLSKCVHSAVKVPKRRNRVLLLFEEDSLHQIDLDLQYKYLRFLLGSPVARMFPNPIVFPKHSLKLQTVAICKKVDSSGESGGHSINIQPLEHIPFKKQSFHENSSLVRNFLAPTQVCAPDPDQYSTVQKDTMALSKLKSHVTPEKDKQCHVWFQETSTYESVDLMIQKKAQDAGGSHSIQNSEDFTDSQTDIENSDNLEECSAHDVHESEDCIFLDATPYLRQEAETILFELQKGIPVENLYKKKKVKMGLKPLYSEDLGSHHLRGHRQHSSIVTPHSYESHKSRMHRSKRGWSSKMRPPDLWCHSSSNTIEVPSVSSSISFNGEMLSQTTVSGKNYSLVPLTESNIKLHLTKSQGKHHRHSESRERRKAKLDFFRKNSMPWECDDSYTKSKEKHTRRKDVRDYESERLDYFPSKYKSSAKPHQEDISFHSEKNQNQPFFYACIPADSLEIIPQTIRWTIPPKTLRKRNFRVPLVAKISTSYSIWNSSKKLLESLLESFSLLH
ncbi:coiled-coil domain-containing protein 168 [Oryx dammah]|uniref:coiled-coil domain-containing protein 168 n=1 Tax=Oryx dammah TaxID=59534 RepID=UPI001A9B3EA3|nr:coiled-coil domain-containing protein 168 [Oryx dammah]